jgi:hypothetical protein
MKGPEKNKVVALLRDILVLLFKISMWIVYGLLWLLKVILEFLLNFLKNNLK